MGWPYQHLNPHTWHSYMMSLFGVMRMSLTQSHTTDVLAEAISGVNCEGKLGKTPKCIQAQGILRQLTGTVTLINSIITFFISPIVGIASDRYGRKPMYIIGSIIDSLPIFSITAYEWGYEGNIYTYFFARVIAAFVTVGSIGLAYMADIKPPHERSVSFARLMSIDQVAMIIGNIISISKRASIRGLYLASSLFSMLSITYAVFILPESLRKDRRRKDLTWCQAFNPIRNLSILNRNKLLRLLTIITILHIFVTEGQQGHMYSIYKSEFGADPQFQVYFHITRALGGVFVQTLLWPLLKKIGFQTRTLMFIGLGTQAVTCPMYGFITDLDQAYVVGVIGAVETLTIPAIAAIKANNVGPDEQAWIQSALGSIRAVAMGFSSFTLGYISTIYQDTNPFIIFYIGGIIGLINFLVAFSLPVSLKHAHSIDNEVELTEKQLADVVGLGTRSASPSSVKLLSSHSPSISAEYTNSTNSKGLIDNQIENYTAESPISPGTQPRSIGGKIHAIDLQELSHRSLSNIKY